MANGGGTGLAGFFAIDRVGFTITVMLVQKGGQREDQKGVQTSPKTEDDKKYITERARQSRQSHHLKSNS